jgi:MFS family permease
MGPIFNNVMASYDNNPKTSDLMTYPTLFMGIGNLISMPVAMAIGRRPVFLCSALFLVIGSAWCAGSQSLGSHIAGRDILSMAAGQSEALCPLIIQVRRLLRRPISLRKSLLEKHLALMLAIGNSLPP